MASGIGSIKVPCSFCGREVRRSPSTLVRTNGRAYCGQQCRDQDRPNRTFRKRSDAGKTSSPQITRPCAACGELVTRRATDARPRVFCNRACYFESVRREGRPGRLVSVSLGQRVSDHGYVLIYVGRDHPMAMSTGYAPEHRLVMAEVVGRPLLRSEDVHHKNGIPSDNRPENLELWTRDHPHGVRVTDLLAWARGFLAEYGPVEDRLG